ncbi:MAG: hypothetical protein WA667_10795 [Candidatus Nitrosopolaris sp.]
MDYGETPTVKQILSSTQVLESINVDEEAMQFFVRGLVNDIWKRAFKEEEKTVFEIKREGKNGNKFHDLVVDTFLYEYGELVDFDAFAAVFIFFQKFEPAAASCSKGMSHYKHYSNLTAVNENNIQCNQGVAAGTHAASISNSSADLNCLYGWTCC